VDLNENGYTNSKNAQKAILPVRWADGWEAEKSTKIPKK
jgi:hypothetical protein